MATINYALDGEIAFLVIDNPPVNALAQPIRTGIVEGIARANADPAVRGIVLIGAGKTFVAGADIKEFGKKMEGPDFLACLAAVESSARPVVAALHGNALGGGLELALASHHRVGLATLKIGLPEIHLGLLPGAGGTQRVPRLVGARKALDMILGGQPVAAAEALALGLLDAIVAGTTGEDLSKGAAAFLRDVLARGVRPPLVRDRTDKTAGTDPGIFPDVRAKNASKWKGQIAPFHIVDCIEAACSQSFEEGSRVERARFLELMSSPQSRALRHIFFAEREASKVPGLPDGTRGLDVRCVAVIGAGTMGGGIAMAFANAGIPVQQVEVSAEALARGRAIVEKNYATSVDRGSTPRAAADKALGLIGGSTDYATIRDCDLVIEAAFEDMAIKKEIFGKLDAVMKPGAVLATNTSTLSIDEIASATKRPEAVAGMHFFSPANVMKLLENVRGARSSPETIATVMGIARRIAKVPVLAGNDFGFIGNRILYAYGRECDFLLEEGATPWQVDRALQAFGFPMGLYLVRDLAGLDVGWRVRKGRASMRDPALRYSPVADRICELGRFGQKTGAGYYRYEGRTPSPDPEIEVLIRSVASELGIRRRADIGDDEIVSRAMCAMVNEGARILDEGIALRAGDIDVAYVYGYGFPRWRGGPMFWAQSEGLAQILERIRSYEAAAGAHWKPAALLERRAAAGGGWSAGTP